MPYNIKTLSMYAGLLCMFLLFCIIIVLNICCKIRNDIIAKRTKLEALSDGNVNERLIEEDEEPTTPTAANLATSIGE